MLKTRVTVGDNEASLGQIRAVGRVYHIQTFKLHSSAKDPQKLAAH